MIGGARSTKEDLGLGSGRSTYYRDREVITGSPREGQVNTGGPGEGKVNTGDLSRGTSTEGDLGRGMSTQLQGDPPHPRDPPEVPLC